MKTPTRFKPRNNAKRSIVHELAGLMLVFALASAAQAGPRTSVNYSVVTDTTDGGGTRATSAAYTSDGSVGRVSGISAVANPAEAMKHGYIAQLYEVIGLTLTSATSTVHETLALQLGAWQALDDATFLAVPATSVAWNVQSGPLTSINVNGLAMAGTVYQATAATAQGVFADETGSLGLTVLDSIPDNFGSYAGDTVGDDWQVQYFGQNNPNAAPLLDPDGDGQMNLFEFTAGLVPTDSASRFLVSIAAVPGQPGQKKVVFSPRLTDRTYVVKASANLSAGTWNPIAGSAPSDNGPERTITDLSASGPARFYRVEITKP